MLTAFTTWSPEMIMFPKIHAVMTCSLQKLSRTELVDALHAIWCILVSQMYSSWQVHVVAKSEYVIPEGNRLKAENSRKTERKKEFPPRHMLREQFERDVASAPIAAQPA